LNSESIGRRLGLEKCNADEEWSGDATRFANERTASEIDRMANSRP
jgi:hypothetical protein